MATFQRARSEEQRAARRRAILDTASAMLGDMTVAQISLNELSRRVGLAKSNVLRYFESREAVLLELLDTACRDWLLLADRTLRERVPPPGDDAPACTRSDALAAVLADTLASRPVLCDLISAQSAVLERNVSAQVAVAYKRASAENVGTLASLVRRHLPEMGARDATRFAAGGVVVTGALWSAAHPSPGMAAAYAADPALAAMRLDFREALTDMLRVLAAGLLARPSAEPPGDAGTPPRLCP